MKAQHDDGPHCVILFDNLEAPYTQARISCMITAIYYYSGMIVLPLAVTCIVLALLILVHWPPNEDL